MIILSHKIEKWILYLYGRIIMVIKEGLIWGYFDGKNEMKNFIIIYMN